MDLEKFSKHPDHEIVPIFEDFEIINVIGKGTYANVFLVKKLNGIDKDVRYAMKVINKQVAINSKVDHIWNELSTLKLAKNLPYLSQIKYAFQCPKRLYFILEFVEGGDLFTLAERRLELDQIKWYLAQLTVALGCLHYFGVVYRDLKLENLMLDKEGNVIIVDFGLSRKLFLNKTTTYGWPISPFNENYKGEGVESTSFCGTKEYMAPELWENSSNEDKKKDFTIDWYSLGVLAHELIVGRTPFNCEELGDTTEDVKRANPYTVKKLSQLNFDDSIMDMQTWDFISKLLNPLRTERLGFKGPNQVMSHPFFNGIDFNDIKSKAKHNFFKPDISDQGLFENFKDNIRIEFDFEEYMKAENAVDIDSAIDPFLNNFYFISNTLRPTDRRFPYENICDETLMAQKYLDESKFFKKYDIDLSKFLGKGGEGVVRICKNLKSNQTYAVKIVDLNVNIQSELLALRQCKHENAVNLVEYCCDSKFHYIIMDRVSGCDLVKTLMKKFENATNNNRPTFNENAIMKILNQLVFLVEHLQKKHIIHCDIKPDNIMITGKNEITLVDFGSAKVNCRAHDRYFSEDFTLEYCPPEVFNTLVNHNHGGYSKEIDIWGVGVVVYSLIFGTFKQYFYGKTEANKSLKEKREIYYNLINIDSNWPKHLSGDLKDLLKLLLKGDPKQRITMNKLKDHKYVQKAAQTLKKIDRKRRSSLCSINQTLTEGTSYKTLTKSQLQNSRKRACVKQINYSFDSLLKKQIQINKAIYKEEKLKAVERKNKIEKKKIQMNKKQKNNSINANDKLKKTAKKTIKKTKNVLQSKTVAKKTYNIFAKGDFPGFIKNIVDMSLEIINLKTMIKPLQNSLKNYLKNINKCGDKLAPAAAAGVAKKAKKENYRENKKIKAEIKKQFHEIKYNLRSRK